MSHLQILYSCDTYGQHQKCNCQSQLDYSDRRWFGGLVVGWKINTERRFIHFGDTRGKVAVDGPVQCYLQK